MTDAGVAGLLLIAAAVSSLVADTSLAFRLDLTVTGLRPTGLRGAFNLPVLVQLVPLVVAILLAAGGWAA